MSEDREQNAKISGWIKPDPVKKNYDYQGEIRKKLNESKERDSKSGDQKKK